MQYKVLLYETLVNIYMEAVPRLQCLRACACMDSLSSLDVTLLSNKVKYSSFFMIVDGSFNSPLE